MAKTLEIRLSDLSDQAKELILAKAEEWQTSPEDAMSRLLDQLALESEKQSSNPVSQYKVSRKPCQCSRKL